ncbi:MAG: NAD-dependent epimerase/dehydratase family protein [Planctomycetota bacterium]
MIRVLVTGANGFVGREATAALCKAGYEVRAAVRRLEPSVEALGCETVAVGDMSAHTDWSTALRGVDLILHLAARAHITRDTCADSLAEFRTINVGGTTSLAKQAAQYHVRRLVYVSSVKVNGEVTNGRAFTEDDPPDPCDAYGISKWEAEQALRRIASGAGMETVVIRPVLVYGPRVRANFLTLLHCVYRGIPLPFAAVRNRRSMIALRNLIDLLVCALQHAAAAGETFLVSDGEDHSSAGWVRRIAGALGRPARLLPMPVSWIRFGARVVGQQNIVQRVCSSLQVDSSKAVKQLSWHRPVNVNEELRRTADWYLGTFGRREGISAWPQLDRHASTDRGRSSR